MITYQDSMEVVYLDLDGDGVPDAVQTYQLRSRDVTVDGCSDVMEATTTIESGIGIDGVAASTETRSRTFVERGLRRSA